MRHIVLPWCILVLVIVKHGITMVSCPVSHAIHWYLFVCFLTIVDQGICIVFQDSPKNTLVLCTKDKKTKTKTKQYHGILTLLIVLK